MALIDPISLPATVILAGLSTCPAHAPTQVDVKFMAGKPAYDKTLKAEDIRIATGRPKSTKKGYMLIILGMTKGEISYDYDMVFSSRNLKDGTSCLSLDKATLKVHYNPRVFIAGDFLKLCKFDMIATHEQKHVNKDIEIATKYLPEMKTVLATAARGLKTGTPVAAGEIDARKQQLRTEIMSALTPLRAKIQAERKIEQMKFDTPEAYAAEPQPCHPPEHWFDKFMWRCCNILP